MEKTDSSKCQQCNKLPATFHFSVAKIDGDISKSHLCDSCSKKNIAHFPRSDHDTEILTMLRAEMQRAIKEERYEDAASLRDRLAPPSKDTDTKSSKKRTKKGDSTK